MKKKKLKIKKLEEKMEIVIFRKKRNIIKEEIIYQMTIKKGIIIIIKIKKH